MSTSHDQFALPPHVCDGSGCCKEAQPKPAPENTIQISSLLWCSNCQTARIHERSGCDICCTDCHGITFTEATMNAARAAAELLINMAGVVDYNMDPEEQEACRMGAAALLRTEPTPTSEPTGSGHICHDGLTEPCPDCWGKVKP